ncbi:MAG TPA: ROK family protein [Terriglobales bacterium]|nr:ROK family protein [Terriglobales bacterium]
MASGDQNAIGVDIGGTKVAAGLVNPRGRILRTVRKPMVTQQGAELALQSVIDAIDELKDAMPTVRGIGISVPGWVDSRQGVLLSATNLPCWRDYPLAEQLKRHYKLPTQLANDANAAALAEAVWGAGEQYRDVFYVSLGTGVGTGMVLDRRLYSGRTGAAGEGGHTTIDYGGRKCGCGKRGCIEMYASGSAVAQRARELLSRHGAPKSRIPAMVDGDLASISAETVAKAALAGDELANELVQEAANYLAIWLGNMIDLLEPDVIVIGGGFGQAMANFFHHIRSRLGEWVINPRWQQIPLRTAMYGWESGLVGAAALCLPRSRLWIVLRKAAYGSD